MEKIKKNSNRSLDHAGRIEYVVEYVIEYVIEYLFFVNGKYKI